MSSSAPRVSVVLPTFNRVACVGDAIASALAQDYPDLEVVVVDDGSTDGTLDAVRRRFGDDPRLRLHRQANGGTARARNAGLDLATGAFVCFLDSDDAYLPGYVAAQVARLSASPSAAMSVCDAAYEGPWPDPGRTLFERLPRGLPTSVEDMVRGGWILITCLLFRAPVIRSLRFDPAWYAEDSEMLCRFFRAGHTYVVEPRVLTAYRKHAEAVGAPQRSVRFPDARVEAVRLASAYYPFCRFPLRERGALRRKWAKHLTELGCDAEARPHLWAWWRHRPFQLTAPWWLLRGALRRRDPAGPSPTPRPGG
jgi:glycosyltransferase involved in cell wall biosynthesis